MRRFSLLIVLLAGAPSLAEPAYQPPPAEQVPNYFATELPCELTRGEENTRTEVKCKDDLLKKKSFRELSILRNTVFARYGWDGYRKAWLRDYFHSQRWFTPDKRFAYKRLSQIDRKNVHYIAVAENSLTTRDLSWREREIYARNGKVWNDRPFHGTCFPSKEEIKQSEQELGDDYALFTPDNGEHFSGENGESAIPFSLDCYYYFDFYKGRTGKYRPDPKFTIDKLSAEDRIELGLISRALGKYASDEKLKLNEKDELQVSSSLDRLLSLDDLRQMSLRDLRLLRNTIYARRGRTFKSKILQEHFQGMSWYKTRPDYDDTLLTATDQRNIRLIKTVENEFGGALSDEDWLVDPAVDQA